jgi:hypothetical protein
VANLDHPDISGQCRYAFSDFQRSMPLLWLFAGFVVVVVAFGLVLSVPITTALAAAVLRPSAPDGPEAPALESPRRDPCDDFAPSERPW